MFDYALKEYSWEDALLWGNFAAHCKEAQRGDLKGRVIHVLIAIIEFLPIISQISSIFEMIIVNKFRSTINSQHDELPNKPVKDITMDVNKHKESIEPPVIQKSLSTDQIDQADKVNEFSKQVINKMESPQLLEAPVDSKDELNITSSPPIEEVEALIGIQTEKNDVLNSINNVSESFEKQPSVVIHMIPEKRSIELVPTDKSLKGFEKIKFLIAENQQIIEREPIIPIRRTCGSSGFESHTGRAQLDNFITETEIIKVHPIRFLSQSPFANTSDKNLKFYSKIKDDNPMWESLFHSYNKQLLAIAVTENGKHVILQQSVRSCVPTCVGMLALDHRKTPNYEKMIFTDLANLEEGMQWIKEAGLVPHVTSIHSYQEDKAEVLAKCLKEYGPGILSIKHPVIGGHVIVLDEISKADNTATIRDSFHGWVLTIKLDLLLQWTDNYFLQVSDPS